MNLVGPPERVAGQSFRATTGALLSGGLKGMSRIRSSLIHPQLLELPRGTIGQWAHGYVAVSRGGSDRARRGGCYEVGAMGPDPVPAARGFRLLLGRGGFDPPLLSPTANMSPRVVVVGFRSFGSQGPECGLRVSGSGSCYFCFVPFCFPGRATTALRVRPIATLAVPARWSPQQRRGPVSRGTRARMWRPHSRRIRRVASPVFGAA